VFAAGFEKTAVSAKWMGARSAGGVATRAGFARGSAGHAEATRLGGELFDKMGKKPLSALKRLKSDVAKPGGAQASLAELREAHKTFVR
jgi:hypothetical protein